MKKHLFKTLSALAYLFTLMVTVSLSALAQVQDIPRGDESGRLELDSTAQIITFIVIPLLFILLYVWLRKRRKNR